MLNYVKGIIVADFITRKTLEIGCLKSGLSIRETLYFHFRNSYIDSATLYTPKTFTNIFFHKCDEKNRIYNQQMMVIVRNGGWG